MDKKNRDKARKDSAEDIYDPPHKKPGGGWLNDYSEKEREERQEYRETWRSSRDNRHKPK